MPLLTAKDVRDLVPQEDFSEEQLAVTMRLIAHWLRDASGRVDVAADPQATPLEDTDPLWGPALELVALFAENPTSLASRTSGPTSRTWPQARRRDAILAGVREKATAATSGSRGSFPPPPAYPDPVAQPVTAWWVW